MDLLLFIAGLQGGFQISEVEIRGLWKVSQASQVAQW